MQKITAQREQIEGRLAQVKDGLADAAQAIESLLRVMEDAPGEVYRLARDAERRQLNQALFERLYVEAQDITDDRPTDAVGVLVQAHRAIRKVPHQTPPMGHF